MAAQPTIVIVAGSTHGIGGLVAQALGTAFEQTAVIVSGAADLVEDLTALLRDLRCEEISFDEKQPNDLLVFTGVPPFRPCRFPAWPSGFV